MMWRTAFVAFLLFWAGSSLAAIDVYHFDSAQQEQQFQELSSTLRCPKCQNNTIADSNAALAQDLRHKVYEMTIQGKSRQEIIDYMVARYGDFITYNPPLTLGTLILWVGPLLVLMLGGVFIWRRHRLAAPDLGATQGWDSEKEARLQSLLASSDKNEGHK